MADLFDFDPFFLPIHTRTEIYTLYQQYQQQQQLIIMASLKKKEKNI
jgi:hypothetical protein